ncbi:hypothetical protein FLK61_30000 [Paenalkalicoccus suaedae]|uniref:Stage III sporulation protein AG n=1 Tax=Paenalkalicoccus suaedae TaxID=2592382 RepID=A0A859FD18_9BACI|nr:hypothetical protein [Paenalkalicoccus suaedae]QKS70957.1 hypothetical protein FLK61_30000 [Paenalkalicoccus suaedae]
MTVPVLPLKQLGKKQRLYLLISLLCIGIILMILSFTPERSNESQTAHEIEQEEATMEERLQDMLEGVLGISNVTVFITLEGSGRNEFEKNKQKSTSQSREQLQEGGMRVTTDEKIDEQLITVREDKGESPVLIEHHYPEIRGVLITANGVEDINSRTWIIEAVSRALDVSTHRISVMPKKREE